MLTLGIVSAVDMSRDEFARMALSSAWERFVTRTALTVFPFTGPSYLMVHRPCQERTRSCTGAVRRAIRGSYDKADAALGVHEP